MRSNGKTEFGSKERPHGISERGLMLLVGILLLFAIGLMLYVYHAEAAGIPMPSPTPAPPTATPILDDSGAPAPIDAWFPALQGESFFAKASGGQTLLVDAGTKADAADLTAFLKEQSVFTLDAVFLSSAEDIHIGGMTEILSHFSVGCFYLTPECAADSRCKALLETLSDRNISVQQVHASFVSTVEWAEHAELRILSPHDVRYSDAADESLMLRLAYGNSEILLAGCTGELAERMAVKALPNQLLHADVLKLSANRDANSTSERFLGAVKPDIAILLGEHDAPLPEKLQARLTQKHIPLSSTQEHGTIQIMLDGVCAKVVE